MGFLLLLLIAWRNRTVVFFFLFEGGGRLGLGFATSLRRVAFFFLFEGGGRLGLGFATSLRRVALQTWSLKALFSRDAILFLSGFSTASTRSPVRYSNGSLPTVRLDRITDLWDSVFPPFGNQERSQYRTMGSALWIARRQLRKNEAHTLRANALYLLPFTKH